MNRLELVTGLYVQHYIRETSCLHYRSRTSTHGRNMAGARALWRATGMTEGDFGKPIIAIANSFTQFVPGHVHLKDMGQLVAREIEKAGGIAKEFNTIAIDDGIAMGHDGMLYSLPSRDLIADSVEYMVNAHCADALVCISNCDKITPGHADGRDAPEHPGGVRLRRPDGSGRGEMAGQDAADWIWSTRWSRRRTAIAATRKWPPSRRSACPTCGSCSGMFTANSMNCLTEALGLASAGQRLAGGDARRAQAAVPARRAHRSSSCAKRYYEQDDASVLPRSIATFDSVRERDDAGHRHGRLDQHRAAPARHRAARRVWISP